MSTLSSEMNFIIGISPNRANTGSLSPSQLPKKRLYIPSTPRRAHSLPTYLVHQQSKKLGSSPRLSQPTDGQRKIGTLPGPTLYTAIFIARYHLLPKSEKRLRSKSQLQATALLLTIFYGVLNVHGRAFTEWARSLDVQNHPITTSYCHIEPRHDPSHLPYHSALLVHPPYLPDLETQVFILLLVMTFLVFRENAILHSENNAVAMGHHNSIEQNVTLFSIFPGGASSHTWPTLRGRKPPDHQISYGPRSHATGHCEHLPLHYPSTDDFTPTDRRRALAIRRRSRIRRARIRHRKIQAWDFS